jgi:hypothetical protein
VTKRIKVTFKQNWYYYFRGYEAREFCPNRCTRWTSLIGDMAMVQQGRGEGYALASSLISEKG